MFIPISTTEKEVIEGFYCDQPGVVLRRMILGKNTDVKFEFIPGATLYPQTVDDKVVGADLMGGKI